MRSRLKARMKLTGQRNFVRCATVAITIFSWLAISNHCAFGAVATKSEPSQSECPFHSKPAKQKEQSTQVQCCKILRAVVSTAGKSWTRDHTSFSDIDLYFEKLALIVTSRNALLPLLLDTGPPGARSFAELILQRSILAHAPPFLA